MTEQFSSTAEKEIQAVVSLLPAATEIVAAVGGADWLVGRSHECDWPAAVADLPALTIPKLDPALPSDEIDRQVKAAAGGALFELDETLLDQLAPDLILTQAACRVCAVDADAVVAAAAKNQPARRANAAGADAVAAVAD